MKAYLSVDLDFWNGRKFPQDYFDSLVETNLPITFVRQHHFLLKHIGQFENQFDTLINIDYHSDIADRMDGRKRFSKQCPLNCGTWVNFVKGRDKKFIWSYPQKVCINRDCGTGYCHGNTNPFYYPNTYEICRWSSIKKVYRWFPKLEDVVAIGISISPGWAYHSLVVDFKKWYKSMLFNKYNEEKINEL